VAGISDYSDISEIWRTSKNSERLGETSPLLHTPFSRTSSERRNICKPILMDFKYTSNETTVGLQWVYSGSTVGLRWWL